MCAVEIVKKSFTKRHKSSAEVEGSECGERERFN
jgi:hypothetical protein